MTSGQCKCNKKRRQLTTGRPFVSASADGLFSLFVIVACVVVVVIIIIIIIIIVMRMEY